MKRRSGNGNGHEWWKVYGVPLVVGVLSGGGGTYVGSSLTDYKVTKLEERAEKAEEVAGALGAKWTAFDKEFAIFKNDFKRDLESILGDNETATTRFDGLTKDITNIRSEIAEAKQECRKCGGR